MNIYFIGMCISMVLYVAIGLFVSRKIKDAEDFFVAGRKAPLALVSGSVIASFTSTNLFLVDAGMAYDGGFAPMIILCGIMVGGYIFGAIFIGRYLRRSRVLTLPEFFGMRFCSPAMKKLAAVTGIITMLAYLLSVVQGIGTLMNFVTGVDYNVCVILSMIVFTFLTVTSGSSGVLITDTLMASLITLSLLAATFFIGRSQGGWYTAVKAIASNPEKTGILSWSGSMDLLSGVGSGNVIWGIIYGIVWMSVCMVGPWQSSRYLMAKDEHTVVRSSFITAIGIFFIEFLACLAAIFVNIPDPSLAKYNDAMIWASMNMIPTIVGVVLLTGILAAGISSATTFISLIGASVSRDLMDLSREKSVSAGRITMVTVSVMVLILAILNPPAIRWILYLGGSIVASSWMPVSVGMVLSRKLSGTGAFCGMLFGFLSYFILNVGYAVTGYSYPAYLDPCVVGILCNILAMIAGSLLSPVKPEETAVLDSLMVMPESEKDPKEVRKTLSIARLSILIGILFFAVMLALWIIPYLMYRV